MERDRIYRALAITVGDATLAAEAVDEAMARAYSRWDRLSAYDNAAGWVYRVGLNWATSQRRKLALRPVRRASELDRPIEDLLPDVDLAERLSALDSKHRAVVVLRYYLQMTPTEIAEVLDVPAGTVKSRLHRALGQLRVSTKVAP